MAKPGNDLLSYVIDGMIQGVSQQSTWDRRDTQCEAQFDCVNSPVNGCEARPGFDDVKKIGTATHPASFCYEIFRGDVEHYLVVIDKTASGSPATRLHVYNLVTGNECTVTNTGGIEAYLATSADPRDSLFATTLQDFTFIGNREVTTRMSTTKLSPAKANSGILFVKAGGYLLTYQVAVTYAGHVYTWQYTTPDNSTVSNAAYISTNQIAAAFFRSFTGVDAVVTTSGTVVGSISPGSGIGVGPAGTGDPATGGGMGIIPVGAIVAATGSTTLSSLGFTVKLNGSCIMISRTDDAAWDLDTGDGVGNTYLLCAKDTIQSFSDLPATCFSGFTVKVIGSNQQRDDDYFVQFIGADGSSGYWEEVIAPGTSLTFDETTMPMALVNTAANTFEFRTPPWGNRVSGDGIFTAVDPSFIGRPLQEMAFDNGRFALMSEGSCVWSRAINNFVFFPDSAQTTVDSDPIDVKPAGGTTIALLRRIVRIAETTFLWAEKIQFRATSGVNPFTQNTVQLPPSTNYEFSPNAIPKPVGQSLYFATELGAFATVRDLAVQNNLPIGATDVTGHVKKYIPTGLRWITASDTLGVLFCVSDGAPNNLYAYNYLLSATARLQSAWNTWRLPANCTILWAGMDLNVLMVLVARTDGTYLLRANLSVDLVDTDAGATYHTRLDFRVPESACTASYSSTTGNTTITAPYNIYEAAGWTLGSGPCPIMIGNRDGSGTRPRGYEWAVQFISGTSVVVKGDLTGDHWYLGFRIRAERTMSRFYIKTTRGLVPTHRLQVRNLVVNYGNSGSFRAEVTDTKSGLVQSYPMTGRILGDLANTLGSVAIEDGSFKIPVNSENTQHSITLINDSYLPSQWASCVYEFTVAYIAKPTEFGQSVPSYFNSGGSAGAGNNF